MNVDKILSYRGVSFFFVSRDETLKLSKNVERSHVRIVRVIYERSMRNILINFARKSSYF